MAHSVKNPPAMLETWVGKIPWRRKWHPTPVFLPGESPWTEEPGGLQSMGRKKLDMTEQLTLSLFHITKIKDNMIILIDTENHLINDSFMTISQQIRSRKELLTPELKKNLQKSAINTILNQS